MKRESIDRTDKLNHLHIVIQVTENFKKFRDKFE